MITQAKVNWINTHCFCEYQLYLRECLGIDDLGSKAVEQGNIAHDMLDAQHDAISMPVESLETAIFMANVKNTPFIMREVLVSCERLIGKIDQLEYHLDKVVIVEDKPRNRSGIPYTSDKLQALAYCAVFSEQFPELCVPIYAVIQDENTEQVLWEHEFSQDDKIRVNVATSRVLDVMNGICLPKPNDNPRICQGCRFNEQCPESKARRYSQHAHTSQSIMVPHPRLL